MATETRRPRWSGVENRSIRVLDNVPGSRRQPENRRVNEDGPRTSWPAMLAGGAMIAIGIMLFFIKDLAPRGAIAASIATNPAGAGFPGFEILLGLATIFAIGGLILLTQALDPRSDGEGTGQRRASSRLNAVQHPHDTRRPTTRW